MQNSITPVRIANAILQDTSYNGLYVIVEGEKDEKLYQKFLSDPKTRIRPAFGCNKVREVLTILNKRGYDNRIGIIDADFNNILKVSDKIDGLFVTDDHDIEVMMIKTPALEDVLHTICSKKSIEEFNKKNSKTLRDQLYSLGKEVGYLKLANRVYDLGLVFKPKTNDGRQLKYSNFTCSSSFNFLGKEKLIETVLNYSRNKSESIKSESIINQKFDEIYNTENDLLQLINGHDLSNFLYILMKKIIKSRNRILVDFNSIEDCLILSYNLSFFKDTLLYKQINIWADSNNISIFR